MKNKILGLLGVLAVMMAAVPARAACTEGALSVCFSGGVGGLQICKAGQLGPCTVPPSSCGGTKPFGSLLHTGPDDGTGRNGGLLCGAAQGDNKLCYSCSAQWIYPGAPTPGGQVECRCL